MRPEVDDSTAECDDLGAGEQVTVALMTRARHWQESHRLDSAALGCQFLPRSQRTDIILPGELCTIGPKSRPRLSFSCFVFR